MKITVDLGKNGYDVNIGENLLGRAGEIFDLKRKTLIVTDDGVPYSYAETVGACAKEAVTVVIPQGEESKCFEKYQMLCRTMLENGFNRDDCAVAVGGGVVGDLTGFAAATYMRGIDFYSVPTTVLSQVDSSVGGKTAIDLDGIKNIVGAFHQPKGVIADRDVLSTLSERQYAAGLAEALKTAAIADKELFGLIAGGNPENNIERIISGSVMIKSRIVSEDERESKTRMALNFGHTIGHGIESCSGLLHGECVALGMICMCSEELVPTFSEANLALGLPIRTDASRDRIMNALSHDKKSRHDGIFAVFVNEIGKYEIRKASAEELSERLCRVTR